MSGLFNRMMGRTRYVVCRIFVHLSGTDVTPILGVLNRTAREAIDADGDMEVMGECLVDVCQALLQYDDHWSSVHNEGDVFWQEGEAGDFFNELFTDSAQRYLSEPDLETNDTNTNLTLPPTENVVVMLTIAYEGEVPELETNLAGVAELKRGLKAIIDLHYKHNLRAIQVHFSPARLGDELTSDQLLQHYPELVPL